MGEGGTAGKRGGDRKSEKAKEAADQTRKFAHLIERGDDAAADQSGRLASLKTPPIDGRF